MKRQGDVLVDHGWEKKNIILIGFELAFCDIPRKLSKIIEYKLERADPDGTCRIIFKCEVSRYK